MATYYIPASDGFYGFGTYNGEGRLRFVVERTYNAATNQSTLSIGLQVHGSQSVWGGEYTLQSGAISAGGAVLQTFNGGHKVNVGNYGDANTWYDVTASGSPARWTKTVQHDDSGAASVTLAISTGVSLYRYVNATVGEKTIAFPTSDPRTGAAQSGTLSFSEPRASAIASCPASVATLGSLALSMSRASTAYWHKATVKDSQGRILYTSAAFETALTISSVPRTWFNNYGSVTSFAATVSVQTYTTSACTTAVGSPVTKSVTITADSGMVPTLASGFAAVQPLGNPTGFTGYIQGVSRAHVKLTASKVTHAVGASLASYQVKCQSYTGSGTGTTYDTNILTGAASIPITVTVTDSRGRTASTQLSVTPMAYGAPTVSGVSVFRCGSTGTADENGTYLSAKATAACSSLNGQNSVTLKVKYRLSGGSWSSETTLTSGTAKVLGGALDPDSGYEVLLTATDALGSAATASVTLATRKWAMKFRADGEGVAFGKAPEHTASLELPAGWKLRVGTAAFSPELHYVEATATSNSYGSVYIPTDVYDPRTKLLHSVIITQSPNGNYKPLPYMVSAAMLGFRVMNYASTSSNGVANIAVTYRIYYLDLV